MAKMIPDIPKEFDPRSHEGIMFEELNNLSEEYYVFHSFQVITIKGNVITESETDFVIFHPKKGLLCLEAKAGQVKFENGYWQYGSGKRMKHDGPYIQANRNKWNLSDYMNEHGLEYENEHCKKLHAVWFPDVPLDNFKGKHLPGDGDISITLTSDSFGHIEECIDRIFEYDGQDRRTTCLSEKDVKRILDRVLAPSFSLISLQEVEKERTKNVFKRMLKEQVALLNYLEDQNTAIINGLAGTGKTVMAIEKARRHSENNEDVLFLCYNAFLKDHLKEAYPYSHVHYYTIDGLACKLCETNHPDYTLLKKKLEDMYYEGTFPYKHVIIDEGQDFGKSDLEEEKIIEYLKDNAIDDEKRGGTFYLFYDKNQLIQADSVPAYIADADCKLTLFRNCRNTENIALTSLRLLGSDKSPKLLPDAVMGDIPEFAFMTEVEDTVSFLNSEIDKYLDYGYSSITVLTCKTEETSIIADYCDGSKYKYKRGYVKFTTCRKFKGLESDVVIVVDIDKNSFDSVGEQIMYVGTSRARYKLDCILNMTEEECIEVMEDKNMKYNRNIYKSFATDFNAKYVKM
ncbi:NERD domain-containing protein [Butyrivibrio sp. NC2002]|uniref:NERD domain-containing protein n=1 Tax=Butyrivibrio sp. NC2002 TaxID=1410610 RepID=UPI00055A2523|nr:NERD domain-containing protein [Butyrivibrio sp. NC2002]